MDEIEEFEMKPLTEGLGFESKSRSLRDSVRQSGLVTHQVSRSLPTSPPPEEFEEPKARDSEEVISELKKALEKKPKSETSGITMTTTLPRPGEASVDQTMPEIPAPSIERRDPLKDINFEVPQAEIEERVAPESAVRRGASDAMVRPLVPIPFHLGAAIFDAAIVLALSMIFLVALVSVTGIDVLAVVATAQVDWAAQLSLLILYLAVLEMYLILSRSFFGKSMGEWTFDLQIGEDEQAERASYPFRVLARNLLSLFTGFIVFPIISLIAGKDILGRLVGVQLYRQNY